MKYLQNFKTYGTINESKKNEKKKSCFMTASEYKEKVTPVFKEYNKFLKKNYKYFMYKGYDGLEQYTYPEYLKIELEKSKKQKYSLGENYIERKWIDGNKTTDKVPDSVLKEYKILIKKLTEFFGNYMNKVHSDEINKNKRSVRRAIDDGTYVESLIDGIITPTKLEEIFNSVGLKMSKRILDMKHKVEVEGYTRSAADSSAARNAKFAKAVEKIIKEEDVVKQLRDRKRRSIESLCDAFDKSEFTRVSDFAHSPKINKSNPGANNTLSRLYEKKDYYDKTKSTRIKDFNERVEVMLDDYVDQVIFRFVARSNEKLAVLISKIGIPEIIMGDFTVRGDIEGTIELVWENGYKLTLHARIILAGGTYQVILHERYLFTFYKDGKKIEIEQIDKAF